MNSIMREVKESIEIIDRTIEISEELYHQKSIREACMAMKRGLNKLDNTIERISYSKNKKKNGKNKEYVTLLENLYVSAGKMGIAWESMELCEQLAPIG